MRNVRRVAVGFIEERIHLHEFLHSGLSTSSMQALLSIVLHVCLCVGIVLVRIVSTLRIESILHIESILCVPINMFIRILIYCD